jgi:predicted Zn finger-like uncharacterized protein
MMIECRQCGTRYRIDPGKLPKNKNRVRCAKCKHIFSIGLSRPSILIAKDDKDFHLSMRELLHDQPFELLFTEDGESALELIHQHLPRLVVLDVSLPKIYGFEMAEILRSEQATKEICIILLAAIHDKTRYKRLPESLYGADDYIEAHHVQDKLLLKIKTLLPDLYSPDEGIRERSIGESTSAGNNSGKFEYDKIRKKARRLARIILSDIALYNQKKVEEGVHQGDLEERLKNELREGEEMMKQRFPELEVEECREFLLNETQIMMQKNKTPQGVS